MPFNSSLTAPFLIFLALLYVFDAPSIAPSMFPDWNTSGWGTPFTCFRYAIPELCNFKGRAG